MAFAAFARAAEPIGVAPARSKAQPTAVVPSMTVASVRKPTAVASFEGRVVYSAYVGPRTVSR